MMMEQPDPIIINNISSSSCDDDHDHEHELDQEYMMMNREAADDHDDQYPPLLPGFRFHPTDEELVGFYLKRKVVDERLNKRIDQLIKQLDVYKSDPWDLPKYFIRSDNINTNRAGGHKEWYFFCKRGRKYKNSIRPNRVTGSGFWKATGIDRQIMGPGSSESSCIGLKKSLVYYRGSAGKGVKTDWMMHEFRLPSHSYSPHHLPQQAAEVWTLCRILKREASHHKYTHANLLELGTKKDNVKSINNTNTNPCNKMDLMNHHDKSFISFASPTSLVKPQLNQKKHHLDPNQHQITAISDDKQLFDPSYANFCNSPEMDHDGQFMIKYANWDELRHVVEYFDPYHI